MKMSRKFKNKQKLGRTVCMILPCFWYLEFIWHGPAVRGIIFHPMKGCVPESCSISMSMENCRTVETPR